MHRIHVRAKADLNNSIRNLLRAVRANYRVRVETARLDTLPRDRLIDMGIAPRTEDNQRHSGQTGGMSHPQLW